MEERHVTVAGKTWPLPGVFMVLATQNPVDQEGTWPLPEAQLDRFLMKVMVGYPSGDQEQQIMRLVREEQLKKYQIMNNDERKSDTAPLMLSQTEIAESWQAIASIHVAETIERYIVNLIAATRQPQSVSDQLASYINIGVSPRGTLALERCGRAQAWLEGRDAVLPEDVRRIAPAVIRHRLMLSYQASADNRTADDIVALLLDAVVA
jgi:MoxR-like ATPase